MSRDLVEPEGVNAGSGEALRDDRPDGDPVPGGDAGAAPSSTLEQRPPDDLPGPPPEPAGNTEEVFGSETPA